MFLDWVSSISYHLPSISVFTAFVMLCYAAFLQLCEIKNIDTRGFNFFSTINKNTAAIEREPH